MTPNINVRYLWMVNGSWMGNGFSFLKNYLEPLAKGKLWVVEFNIEALRILQQG